MVEVEKPREAFSVSVNEKVAKSPGMPPTSRARPRPQSAGRKASLFSKYGNLGFAKFQDNIKHLQTPTPPKKGSRPSKNANKILPINLDPSDDPSPAPGSSGKTAFLSPERTRGGGESSESESGSGKKGSPPPFAAKTPPMPKKLNWESYATTDYLSKDPLTFSQRRHRSRSRTKSKLSVSSPRREVRAEADSGWEPARASPAPSVISVPEKAATAPREKAAASKNKGKKKVQGKASRPDEASGRGDAPKGGAMANINETYPLSVSHTLYTGSDVASTSKSRGRSVAKGELKLSWASHLKTNGSMPQHRMGHSQSSVNLSLFIFGGATGGKFLNDFWIYSSETATWCKKPCVGAVPSPRGYHTTNVLHTGRRGDSRHRLVIFGGWDGRYMFDDLYVVEGCEDLLFRKSALFTQIKLKQDRKIVPRASGSAKGSGPPSARAMHTMTSVYFGDEDSSRGAGEAEYHQQLVLFGGWSRQSFLNDMHVYNVEQETWTRVRYKETGSEGGSEVPDPRGSHTTVAVRDQLYVFGGQKETGPCDELWTFNIATRTWTLINQQGARPSPRSGHACVLLEDRYLLLFGGYSGQKHLSDMYILDTSSMIWEQTFLPLGHPLGRSAHQITMVAQTRAYMTFGWSTHGVLCDLHALDTRDPLLKTISVTGGPYSSKLCQVAVEFAKEKEKSAPISIQWHRSKNGKPFAPIEGATSTVYMPTADDINTKVGASCMPCEGKVPLGPSYFGFTQQIEVDPELGALVKSLVNQDKAKFSVSLLTAEKGVAAKMYLVFTSTFFELRTKTKTSFKEAYQTSFRVILSTRNPYTFVLQVHQGLSLPFGVDHLMERDLVALVARSFWALALKNLL